ncbi:aromatic ring-hydroxylating dioxygenase subunit alpha [Streptomyces nogalater]|uniref:Aromatic ring-hydroxylating dioxygenase subunit alpha n=1 Tax=Streptomyces nogalater TaxID=38314 RepID=A0ABW0WD62_STRNO
MTLHQTGPAAPRPDSSTTPPLSPETADLLAELGGYLVPDPPALSLPPRAFASGELYELEREKVFGRSWLLVAHTDQLAAPGAYVALTVAGEPVVITRGDDGALHAMSPICRHRMMPVVEPGTGRTDRFTCPYHLWRYGLDGRLIGATFMRRNEAFDPAGCRLPQFAVEEWHGFVFVNLDPAAEALAPHLARIESDLVNYRLDDMVLAGEWAEEWHCNWKIAVENAHENYHVMGFHPETLEPSTPGRSDTDLRDDTPWALRFRIPFTEPQQPSLLSLTEDEKAHLYDFFVFPTGSLAAAGEAVIWLSMLPLSLDRTQVRGGMLVPAARVKDLGEAERKEMRQGIESYSAMVNAEDRRGLEAVQRSVGSRFAARGHLSPKEPAVVSFYRNLARALLRGDDEWPGAL